MVDADWPREVVSPQVDGMLRCTAVVGDQFKSGLRPPFHAIKGEQYDRTRENKVDLDNCDPVACVEYFVGATKAGGATGQGFVSDLL